MKGSRFFLLALLYLIGIVGYVSWTDSGFSFAGLLSVDPALSKIVYALRIPRLLVILTVGAVLSAIGATYQVLFSNALAEPYVLGISSAVTIAAALCETFLHTSPQSLVQLTLCIFAATIASLLLLGVGSLNKNQSAEKTVLFGMGMNFVFSSLLFLLLSYLSQQLGGGSLRWLFGQIPWLSMNSSILVLVFGVFSLFVLVSLGRYLDALSFGDSVARSLGVSPIFARNLIVFFTSLIVGVLVSQTGSIGFIGLVVPHMARLLFYPKSSRGLISYSVLIGALFLMVSDFISRSIFPPMEFPIGVVTTLLGGPFFLWFLWKR